jgi:dTMP kinase
VAEALERAGLPVSSFREPTTDGEWGRILRASGSSGRRPPREELELFLKDRAWDLEARVLPALRAGRVAVLDRYVLSSVSYQGALGIPPTEILEANAGFPWPDLTVVLDLEPAEGLRRIREGRGAAADAFEDAQYLAGVREILGLAAALPGVEFMDAKEAVGMTASRIAERVQEAARDKGTRQALRG